MDLNNICSIIRNRLRILMKSSVSRLILVFFDFLSIYISIVVAYYFRIVLEQFFPNSLPGDISHYSDKFIVYIVVVMTFVSAGIYKHRHDFWEETYLILKALALALVLVLSILALSKSIEHYSRIVIISSFFIMAILIPTVKFILKKKLSVFGLWHKNAEVISNDSDVIDEIFGTKYLGYVRNSHINADVVFMDTQGMTTEEVESKLLTLSYEKKEVIFIPILNSFNFANAKIIEIFNARRNMIVLESSLMKWRNRLFKKTVDMILSLLLIPLLVPIFALIIYLMRKEEPKGSIFFKQDRLGKDGEVFVCYKFRSMREDGDKILKEYLTDHPEEVESYEKYHKYINDPRITKVGNLMRRTSLDELPQIINVFKGEMSLIGPRPYMLNEKAKIGSNINMVLAVKPGITGLWQVSGRSDVDFHSRVDIDVYYTRNWNLWMDVVVLIKTIKTVLFREGAS